MLRVFIPGRLQLETLEQYQLSVLLDVSHNPQATKLLAKKIEDLVSSNFLLFGDFATESCDLVELVDPAVKPRDVGRGERLGVGAEALDVEIKMLSVRTGAPKQQVHAVFSAMKDKDILQILQLLKNSVDFWYLATLDYPRGASADYLLALSEKAGIMAKICYTSPSIAFTEALNHAKPGDLIVVFGSFFTVSDVLTRHDEFLAKRDII